MSAKHPELVRVFEWLPVGESLPTLILHGKSDNDDWLSSKTVLCTLADNTVTLGHYWKIGHQVGWVGDAEDNNGDDIDVSHWAYLPIGGNVIPENDTNINC